MHTVGATLFDWNPMFSPTKIYTSISSTPQVSHSRLFEDKKVMGIKNKWVWCCRIRLLQTHGKRQHVCQHAYYASKSTFLIFVFYQNPCLPIKLGFDSQRSGSWPGKHFAGLWTKNWMCQGLGAGLLWPRTDKKCLWPPFLKTRAREACPHFSTQLL